MSDNAIQLENVGKMYRLGASKADNLRNAFGDLINSYNPFRHSQIRKESKKTYKDFWALRNISFNVKKGDAIGIIGRNGAGKSTLLKILSRITEPTEGFFKIDGRISSLLEVGTGFHMELTGRENIFLNGTILGMKRIEIRRKFNEIVEFSGVAKFIDTPVKHYSSGMKVRLAFSVAAHLEPEILLIDEVLAVGDADFQKKCLGKMEDVTSEGRTVLFVSHNMGAIKKLCKKSILLENGKVKKSGKSSYIISDYLDNRSEQVIRFNNDYLKEASVSQDKETIKLHVQYNTMDRFKYPHLGFVLYDQGSNPILGSNPNLSDLRFENNIKSEGFIEVNILNPILNDGIYHISLWFGDGKEDYFVAESCLKIHYENQTYSGIKPNIDLVGPVKPNLEWVFR